MSQPLDEILAQLSPEAFLLEPREHFDAAIVGATDAPKDHWPRAGSCTVAVYDEDKCVEAIMAWLSCDAEAAYDWYCYNTTGAWLGEGTPTFVSDLDDDEVHLE